MSRALLPLIALVSTVTVAACGNAVDAGPAAGITGVSVTERGDVLVQTFVCHDAVDTIDIVRDRTGLDETKDNPTVRRYRSGKPLTGLLTINLTRPAAGWKPAVPTVLEPGKGYLISGESADGYDSETVQVYVRPGDLASMRPGPVYVSGADDEGTLEPRTPAAFEKEARRACR
jgi:hypothetical protein